IDACRIATRTCKACDQTNLDRIFADTEDDRNGLGRRFSSERSGVTARGGDDRYSAADEVGHKRGQTIVAALEPMVLHCHVLTPDVTGLLEPFAKSRALAAGIFRRPTIDESNHW